MNAEYRVILERREPGKIPIISPYSVSKTKCDECQKSRLRHTRTRRLPINPQRKPPEHPETYGHRGLEEFHQQTAEAKRARALRKQPLRQTSVSNEHFDLMYQAMRPGKRFSASGHRYYERRSNRTDKGKLL